MTYHHLIKDKQNALDQALLDYKAQPVGDGYIDIIVQNDNARHFASKITELGILIGSIAVWEYIDDICKSPFYGLGGPKSIFYTGRFSEANYHIEQKASVIKSLSNTEFDHEHISEIITQANCILLSNFEEFIQISKGLLLPGFWLVVDDGWKSPQVSSPSKI
jgi:hypothetical protein